jgi:DNA-binding winged helix-turn-helix (wHTH) protein/TolB-like protein/Flp pilus assembly protein TadD
MRVKTKHFYEFGGFRIDMIDRLLLRDSDIIPLAPKAFDLLLTLVENSGHVLSKDELMKQVWPDSFVEEANLSHHVFTLRKALGEEKNGAKFIETIPRRGYRFVADVTEVEDPSQDLVVAEHMRSHIVIEEVEETNTVSQAIETEPRRAASGLVGNESAESRFNLKALLPWVVSFMFITLSAIVYFLVAGKPTPQTSSPALKSIAVLPFKPLVVESHDEYLEVGMADTLITKLSNLKQLVVRPTSAIRKYTNLQQDAVEAGRELQVEGVLDGGIQRLGERLRVTVRLIKVKDGTTIWADKFDEKATDLFAVQDAISERLATALALKLSGESEKLLTLRYTTNIEAYQLYIQGRSHWSTFKPQELETSIKYYNAALEKDPSYALAYCGLANAYSVMGIYGPLPPQEAYPKSREAALKALGLDDNLGQAHAALGAVKIFYDWDWAGAEQALKRAIELNPNNLDAHSLYGYCLQARGMADEAVIEERRAHEIDPVWPVANNDVAVALYLARHYDEAINYAQDTLNLNPNSLRMLCIQGHAYIEKGVPDESLSAFRQVLTIQPNHMRAQAGLGYTYARMGKRHEALEAVKQIKGNNSESTERPHFIAAIYAALGDTNQAFIWLEKAYTDHSPRMWQFKLDPRFNSLRSDERFQAFLRHVNLSQ